MATNRIVGRYSFSKTCWNTEAGRSHPSHSDCSANFSNLLALPSLSDW